MKTVLFLSISLLLFGCDTNQRKRVESSSHKIDMAKELAAIEKVRESFSSALKEGRYEDIGQWITSDVKTVRPGGPGWDNMFALAKERGRFPYDSIFMKPTETYIMNDTMAYDWGASSVYYTNEAGNPVELKNSFLVILKKENGEWKLHREVGSSIVE
jgi:ketosteroid isomerase-like protein